MNFNILYKNETPTEKEIGKIVEKVLVDFYVPHFTETILIDDDAVPHSHPVLTLGTKVKDPLVLLKTLAHEQFHWFVVENVTYIDCLDFLKKKYSDLGDCNKNGQYSDSFWEHLIVCWNTRNYIQNHLNSKEIEYVYTQWQPYPLTEVFVRDNFEIIKDDLINFSMVYMF